MNVLVSDSFCELSSFLALTVQAWDRFWRQTITYLFNLSQKFLNNNPGFTGSVNSNIITHSQKKSFILSAENICFLLLPFKLWFFFCSYTSILNLNICRKMKVGNFVIFFGYRNWSFGYIVKLYKATYIISLYTSSHNLSPASLIAKCRWRCFSVCLSNGGNVCGLKGGNRVGGSLCTGRIFMKGDGEKGCYF